MEVFSMEKETTEEKRNEMKAFRNKIRKFFRIKTK